MFVTVVSPAAHAPAYHGCCSYETNEGHGTARALSDVQWSVDDPNAIADAHLFVEFNDIEVAHEHAAGTQRLAESRFVIGAVDVNVTSVRVDVAAAVHARLQSAQPQNAGRNEIIIMRLAFEDLREVPAGRDAGFEYHTRWLAGADALGDFMQAARSAE